MTQEKSKISWQVSHPYTRSQRSVNNVQSGNRARAVTQQRRHPSEGVEHAASTQEGRTENESKLWQRYREKGDQKAKDTLVLKYLYLAKYIAGRIAISLPATVDRRDVVSWAVVGLLEAVEKYDPAQKASFSTFASHRIKGQIHDGMRNLDWLPRLQRQRAKKVDAAAEKLRASLGREPRPEEIADEVGMTVDDVLNSFSKLASADLLSLDQPIGNFRLASDEHELTLESIVKDPGSSPLEIAEKTSTLEALTKAISELNENHQKVIYLYYNEGLTLKEVAKVLDLTEGRVCQIHKEAIDKLRVKMARWSAG